MNKRNSEKLEIPQDSPSKQQFSSFSEFYLFVALITIVSLKSHKNSYLNLILDIPPPTPKPIATIFTCILL